MLDLDLCCNCSFVSAALTVRPLWCARCYLCHARHGWITAALIAATVRQAQAALQLAAVVHHTLQLQLMQAIVERSSPAPGIQTTPHQQITLLSPQGQLNSNCNCWQPGSTLDLYTCRLLLKAATPPFKCTTRYLAHSRFVQLQHCLWQQPLLQSSHPLLLLLLLSLLLPQLQLLQPTATHFGSGL